MGAKQPRLGLAESGLATFDDRHVEADIHGCTAPLQPSTIAVFRDTEEEWRLAIVDVIQFTCLPGHVLGEVARCACVALIDHLVIAPRRMTFGFPSELSAREPTHASSVLHQVRTTIFPPALFSSMQRWASTISSS
jgi:hypothetical protein